MRRVAMLLGLVSATLIASVALASPGPRSARCDNGRRSQTARHRSRSVGLPWSGRLEDGVLLRESPTVGYVPEYAARGNFWGTWQLVQLIERAAARVEQRLPGSRLHVGELSRERGRRIDGHHSHMSGRDVDIAFYMTDAHGRPYDPFAFAAFGADGVGLGPNRMLRFDDARNWELVGKLVADGDARVQHIFVANRIKQRLLREGRRRHAPASVLERASLVLGQPSGNPHENHFHVRVYCNPRERAVCRDRAPFHPWYPGTPPGSDASGARGGSPTSRLERSVRPPV